MPTSSELEALRKGIAAFGLTVSFLHEEHTVGRGAAVQALRIGLKREGLWLGDQDEQLLHQVRAGEIDFGQLQSEVCSYQRTGYAGKLPPEGAE
jgi:hypothetical protein